MRVAQRFLLKKSRVSAGFLLYFDLRDFIFKTHIIGNHGDEFAVRGLTALILYRVAEEGVERIDITSVPCNFDCVAYRSLDS